MDPQDHYEPRFNASDRQLHTCMYMFMWCTHMSVKYTCIYKYGDQGITRHILVTF